eukprot:226791-Prymnesium_polylepis.1
MLARLMGKPNKVAPERQSKGERKLVEQDSGTVQTGRADLTARESTDAVTSSDTTAAVKVNALFTTRQAEAVEAAARDKLLELENAQWRCARPALRQSVLDYASSADPFAADLPSPILQADCCSAEHTPSQPSQISQTPLLSSRRPSACAIVRCAFAETDAFVARSANRAQRGQPQPGVARTDRDRRAGRRLGRTGVPQRA